jgi:hypothetical protein
MTKKLFQNEIYKNKILGYDKIILRILDFYVKWYEEMCSNISRYLWKRSDIVSVLEEVKGTWNV